MTGEEAYYRFWAVVSPNSPMQVKYPTLNDNTKRAWEAVAKQPTLYKIEDTKTGGRDYYILSHEQSDMNLESLESEYRMEHGGYRKSFDRFYDWLQDEKGFKQVETVDHGYGAD